jgi:hypothetical protein
MKRGRLSIARCEEALQRPPWAAVEHPAVGEGEEDDVDDGEEDLADVDVESAGGVVRADQVTDGDQYGDGRTLVTEARRSARVFSEGRGNVPSVPRFPWALRPGT